MTDSKDAEFYLNRAGHKRNLGYFKDAIHDFNKAIEINPNDDSAYISRGNNKFILGDYGGGQF